MLTSSFPSFALSPMQTFLVCYQAGEDLLRELKWYLKIEILASLKICSLV